VRQGAAARAAAKVSQCAEDFCNICWVDPLCGAPTLQLGCGHLFHLACAQRRVHERWGNARVTFAFTGCPLCHVPMEHPALSRACCARSAKLREQIERMAMQRLVHEGLERDPDIVDGRFKGDRARLCDGALRLLRVLSLQAALLWRPGGVRGRAGRERGGSVRSEAARVRLVCQRRRGGGGGGETNCAVHGNDFIEYKCKFCCSVATWFCWGTTHLCTECHKTQGAEFTGGPKHDASADRATARALCQFDVTAWRRPHQVASAEQVSAGDCEPSSPTAPPSCRLGCQLCRQVKEF
jgi:hypothetical protein